MKERWEMGTQTMLDRLCNTGATRDIALELFQAKYRYLIFAIASEYGLNDADAENPFRLVEMQFDRMYYRNLILYGLKELRNRINEETYQIFDLAMIQRRPSKDVADFFDVTVNYVNKVKRDNCERLRQMLQEFIEHGDNLPFNTEEEFEQEVTATIANFKEWV